MTNDLEKQFFDTFGIEAKLKTFAIKQDEQGDLTYPPIYEYPQITDRILLELICIESMENPYRGWGGNENAEELKESVLSTFIEGYTYDIYWDSEQIKHQVRTLFEEG